MRVALDGQELADPDRAVAGDAADVVAREVDQHDVLRALLRVGEELAGVRLVLVPRAAARAGPRERAHLDAAVLLADQPLGDEPTSVAPSPASRRNMYGEGFTTRRAR